MAATSTNIVNLALRSLGVARITSLSDSSEQARVMNDLYEHIRDEMIEIHPWNFAIVYSDSLAENDDAPEFDYDYSYALPSDCLRVIELEDAEDEFKVVGDNLYTDTESPKIRYISLVTTTGNYSKSFVTAFAARLAAEACYALTKSQTLADRKWKEYEEKLAQAKSSDSQEGTVTKIENCSWIDDRA